MRVAVFSTKSYDQEYFERFSVDYPYSFFFYENALNAETAHLARGFDIVCVFVNDKVDAPTLDVLAEHGVKLIALRCAGFNNVDVSYANQKGLRVVRVPAYSPDAVAEHALALILTLNRKTHKAYNRVREGNFSLKNLIGFDIHGKTIGVIGTGQIGATFCRIMSGFGCKILAYDLYPNEALQQNGVTYVSLEELFEQSNIISLHCPLNPHTHHIISAAAIERMKPGVMIINTSRGGLIDTAAVIDALVKKKIGYLGIDVYEQEEKLFFEDLSEHIIEDDQILRLNSFPNVLITSHQAYFTREAMEQITLTTLSNIQAFEKKQRLANEVC